MAGPETGKPVLLRSRRCEIDVSDDQAADAGFAIDPRIGARPARAAHESGGAGFIDFLTPHAKTVDAGVRVAADVLDEFLAFHPRAAHLVGHHFAHGGFGNDAPAFKDAAVCDHREEPRIVVQRAYCRAGEHRTMVRIDRREARVRHAQRLGDLFLEDRFPVLAGGELRHAAGGLHGQPAIVELLARFEMRRQRQQLFHRLGAGLEIVARPIVRLIGRIAGNVG